VGADAGGVDGDEVDDDEVDDKSCERVGLMMVVGIDSSGGTALSMLQLPKPGWQPSPQW